MIRWTIHCGDDDNDSFSSDATSTPVGACSVCRQDQNMASERAQLQRALFYRHLVVAPPLASRVRACMACYFTSLLDRSCCLFLFRISWYLVAGVVTITLMIYTVVFCYLGHCTLEPSSWFFLIWCLFSDGALLKDTEYKFQNVA